MLLFDCCDCMFAFGIPKLGEEPHGFKGYLNIVISGPTNTSTKMRALIWNSLNSQGNEWVADSHTCSVFELLINLAIYVIQVVLYWAGD